MKTRTLLLLAVATALVILVAGGIQLIRLSHQDEVVPASEIGETVSVGDMEIVLEGAIERRERLFVDISLGGVNDADGGTGFSLLVPGAGVIEPEPEPGGAAEGDDRPACAATTVGRQQCEVTFDLAGASGDVRTLRYERAGERARWVLPGD